MVLLISSFLKGHTRVMARLANQINRLDSVSLNRYRQKLSLSGYDVSDPYNLEALQ